MHNERINRATQWLTSLVNDQIKAVFTTRRPHPGVTQRELFILLNAAAMLMLLLIVGPNITVQGIFDPYVLVALLIKGVLEAPIKTVEATWDTLKRNEVPDQKTVMVTYAMNIVKAMALGALPLIYKAFMGADIAQAVSGMLIGAVITGTILKLVRMYVRRFYRFAHITTERRMRLMLHGLIRILTFKRTTR